MLTDKYPSTNPIGEFIKGQIPNETLSTVVSYGVGILSLIIFVSVSAFFLIWLERKVCAHFQARLGPMRVGWHGSLQTIADALKLLLKEGLKPRGSDSFLFYLAPLLPMSGTFLVLCVLPFDHHLQFANPDLGALFILAVTGLGIFGLLIGGWASNNKWSLLGSLRTGAQMISFEISIALTVLLIVLLTGHSSMREIVLSQEGEFWNWWIIKAPGVGLIAFVFFLISGTAELNRGPFDMAEAESELTAGFHTEYSGIMFSMFFLAEFINMFAAGAIAATFFLGGFLPLQIGVPGVDAFLDKIPGFVWFMLKSYFVIFLFMWFRWTFPRLRVDQLMNLEWKFLLPGTLVNLVLGAILVGMGWIL